MRPASADLIAFLATRQAYWSADLFTFSLTNGSTLRLTSGDRDITYAGTTWLAPSASNVALTRGAWGVKNTIEVPKLEIDLISSGTDFNGSNIKLAIHNGLLDGAWIEMDRAFMPLFAASGLYGDTSYGTVPIFAGRTGEVQITSTGAKITVSGANILMQQYMPRNRFLTSCIHTLYDTGCTLSRATYTFSGTVLTSDNITIHWVADPTSGNYTKLPLGKLTMTSGVANGQKRTIGGGTSGQVTVLYPFYETPAPGDTFTVTYGCDKILSTCSGRFSNTQNYRGFPYVPVAETAVVA